MGQMFAHQATVNSILLHVAMATCLLYKGNRFIRILGDICVQRTASHSCKVLLEEGKKFRDNLCIMVK